MKIIYKVIVDNEKYLCYTIRVKGVGENARIY